MTTDHVSDLRWDRLLAGELDGDAKTAALAHADACAACKARLDDLTRERDAFAVRPRDMLAARRRRSRAWLAAPAVLAAVAAVVLVLRTRDEQPGERAKGGGPSFVVAAGPRDRLAPVTSGDRVHAGDTVQVAYSAKRAGFGAVLGRDGSGRASVYVGAGDEMVALPAGELQSFPTSLVLDDVPGDEVLLVIWCEARRPLAPYLAALASAAEPPRTAGCWHRHVVLAKRAEPR